MLFPISAHRRQFSARISSANYTRLTMVRLTRASEASSCRGRREHRASLSSQAAENVPFAAGVLYTNDIDYQLARILAMETVTEAPFQEISDEAFARACELMKSCERVIDTGVPVGMCNRRIEELRAEAKRLGKLAE